jgi:hypothetical protein
MLASSQPVPSAPQPIPPRRLRNVIAESPGSLSHSDIISDENEDGTDSDDDDDSDDEEDVTAEQAANFRRGPPSTDFRAPLSTEECSATYTVLQSDLEEWLDDEYETFSTFLVVGRHGYPGAMVETPFLIIAVPDDTPLPSASSLPPSVTNSGLAIVACHVVTEFGIGEAADRGLPRRHLVTGLAVGCHEHTDRTTLGAIVRKPDSSYFGITSGHLFDEGPVGAVLTQSTLAQCTKGRLARQNRIKDYDFEITMATSSLARDTLTIAQGTLQQEVQALEEFIGKTNADTVANLKAGVLVKRELSTAKIRGVRRIIDYSLFDIDKLRSPRGDVWTFAVPTGGVLGHERGPWARLMGWGELEWDLQVRKNGAVTGFTYGVVAGVTTSMKLLENKRTREYYIMPEQNFASKPFVEHGDSGSAIVDRAGNLVAFVMAKSILKDFTVLVHPRTGHLDLAAMQRLRNDDGSIDYERAYFDEFKNINVTLAMCSSVLEERTGIRGMGELVIDC